jgi:hypothetical protein
MSTQATVTLGLPSVANVETATRLGSSKSLRCSGGNAAINAREQKAGGGLSHRPTEAA